MRTLCAIPIIIIVGILPAMAGENVRNLKMQDAITHDQLAQIHRKALQEDPMRKRLKPADGADPSIVNQPEDLLSRSDILCFNGAATIVPKRAIISIPKNLADRLKFQPGSKIMNWPEFYAQNRGWITTVDVTRQQAEGKVTLAEETSKHIGNSKNLVIATYLTGPISMLPPKDPIETAKENPKKPSTEKTTP